MSATNQINQNQAAKPKTNCKKRVLDCAYKTALCIYSCINVYQRPRAGTDHASAARRARLAAQEQQVVVTGAPEQPAVPRTDRKIATCYGVKVNSPRREIIVPAVEIKEAFDLASTEPTEEAAEQEKVTKTIKKADKLLLELEKKFQARHQL